MAQSPRLLRPKASGFTPRSISGLALWLDASDSSTLFQNSDGTVPATATSDPVGYWGDKSGNNRHATQATAGSRPTISANTQASRRMLGFDGANGRLNIAHPVAQSDPVVMIAVARRAASTWGGGGAGGYGSIINSSNGTSAGPQLRVDTGNIEVIGGSNRSSVVGANVGVGSCAIITGTVTNRDTALYVQGALVDSDAGAGAISTAGTSTAIGAWNPTTQGGGPLQGDVAELIVYQASLSVAQRQAIHRYLAAKWGITLAPQVSNADAQHWVNRVYANGGTVSASTASAVNTFCNDIDAAGIRDRFYRLNLFCGTGLEAVLVPLYRGPSRTGTQYGNTTDTNANFVSGDYTESSGLKGNISTKSLATGVLPSDMGSGGIHLASSVSADVINNAYLIGCDNFPDAGWTTVGIDFVNISGIKQRGSLGASAGVNGTNTVTTSSAWRSLITSTRQVGSAQSQYYSGSPEASNTPTYVTLPAFAFTVFATNRKGTPTGYQSATLSSYSIGAHMTAAQAASYNTALTAFLTAIGRPTA